MPKNLLFCLPWLLMSACGGGTEKYRDIQHLEMPPVLTIEHTNRTVVDANPNLPETFSKPAAKSASSTETTPTEPTKPANPDLTKLVQVIDYLDQPTLRMKTRFDRAWDLLDKGLRLAEIEVVDKNLEAGVIKVRYVANDESKGRGFMSSITSFFSDKFEDTEYSLTADKDQRTTDVKVAKVVDTSKAAGTDKEAFNNDDSMSLVKLLHKTIIEDLAK